MRVSVLYSTDGHIVSVMRSAAADTRGASDAPPPETALKPAAGERVAFVEVDPAWGRRPIAEIHQAFTVADGPDGPYLHPHESATRAPAPGRRS
jgi:hypothetical protein